MARAARNRPNAAPAEQAGQAAEQSIGEVIRLVQKGFESVSALLKEKKRSREKKKERHQHHESDSDQSSSDDDSEASDKKRRKKEVHHPLLTPWLPKNWDSTNTMIVNLAGLRGELMSLMHTPLAKAQLSESLETVRHLINASASCKGNEVKLVAAKMVLSTIMKAYSPGNKIIECIAKANEISARDPEDWGRALTTFERECTESKAKWRPKKDFRRATQNPKPPTSTQRR
jgi:hypothetical protein